MKELVEVMAKGLVAKTDQVSVTEYQKGDETILKLHVA